MDVQVVAGAASTQQQPAPAAIPPAGAAIPGATVPGADATQSTQSHAGELSPVLAHLFAEGGIPQTATVNVSYRVEHNPNIVVMEFTDPKTGAVISQVPAEVVVQLAQFFDKHSGVTLDKNA